MYVLSYLWNIYQSPGNYKIEKVLKNIALENLFLLFSIFKKWGNLPKYNTIVNSCCIFKHVSVLDPIYCK